MCLQNCIPSPGPTVHLPNLETITSTAAGLLPLTTTISSQAKLADLFDDLHSTSLVSLGQLCDDGCQVLSDKKNIYVIKK